MEFPTGLRVLVVDDDATTLRIIEQIVFVYLCFYLPVTTCTKATVALNLLQERKRWFDVVLSDVHMPDMDGYKLLEHVGLEMDLPIIMMFGDSTSVVMKGIRHRACDYLIKPVREEELRNIWQHVVRKILNENKEHDNSGSMEDIYWNKRGNDDIEYTSFVADPTEVVKAPKKRSSLKEEDIELESDDPTTSKKPRVMWSVELHQQFVSVVNQLGLDSKIPLLYFFCYYFYFCYYYWKKWIYQWNCLSQRALWNALLVHIKMSLDLTRLFVMIIHLMSFCIVPFTFLFEAGVQVAKPIVQVFNGQEVEVWPHVTWKPKWGLTFSRIKSKVSGNCSISQRSTLAIKGKNIFIENLSLNGVLIIDVVDDAE
ncbi:hypothetical protein V8G54_028518, partial [Vigna mungo]